MATHAPQPNANASVRHGRGASASAQWNAPIRNGTGSRASPKPPKNPVVPASRHTMTITARPHSTSGTPKRTMGEREGRTSMTLRPAVDPPTEQPGERTGRQRADGERPMTPAPPPR